LIFLDDGNKNLPLMVFIHGWPDSPQVWENQINHFRKDYRCIRIELPYFSKSTKETNLRNFDSIALEISQCIHQILLTSPHDKVILIGHDWGAFLSYKIERLQPNLISKLITLDIGGSLKPDSLKQGLSIIGYQSWLIAAYYLGHLIPFFGDSMNRLLGYIINVPDLKNMKWQMNYLYPSYWLQFFKGDLRKEFYIPKVPLLYLFGEQKYFMLHTKKWLRKIEKGKQSSVIGLKKCGHWLMLDKPDEVNFMINDWLKTSEA